MKIALVGNQNSGKTTLFNALTGMHAKIGNWPGVTIEKKTIKVPITGKEVKMWIIAVSVILLIVIGACVCMLIRRKK